jgi:hypothetical protein
MKAQRINTAYNEFRNNQTPYFFNQVENGLITIEHFENWFDQRETTFLALMAKNNI